jgi:tetratricopeptide (TPR) repeat protein
VIRRFRPTPQQLAEFASTGRRLEAERKAAAHVVEPLLRNTPRESWPALAEDPDLKTAGALERLGKLVAQKVNENPPEARAIAELAVAIAEGIAPPAYARLVVHQLQAHAWKDLGKALRYLGKNQESVDALRTAESRIEPGLAHDHAIIRLHLALSLQELDRYEESRRLIVESRHAFSEYGDDRNVVLCALAEGVLLQRLRNFREAREIYLLLLAGTKTLDQETLASLHRAIGLCSVELADFHEAEVNLRHAITLSREIGQPMEALKSETAYGRLLNRRGAPARAVDHLRPVRRGFLRNGLAEEAGICGLEMVEGLLALNYTAPAETLARTIVSEFTAAGLSSRAIAALGYLTEALAAQRASTRLVTEVREYIVSLRTSPERDFATASS